MRRKKLEREFIEAQPNPKHVGCFPGEKEGGRHGFVWPIESKHVGVLERSEQHHHHSKEAK